MAFDELIQNGIIKKGKIEGVLYKLLRLNCDDRGYNAELLKEGELFIPVKQTTWTKTHPGIIKAFHWHKRQTDLWVGISGRARAVLYDLREDSSTFKQFETFYLGEPSPILLLIPPGVAHGYQVLSNEDFEMFYHTDQIYDPKNLDEEQIDYDKLNYDWKIKNR